MFGPKSTYKRRTLLFSLPALFVASCRPPKTVLNLDRQVATVTNPVPCTSPNKTLIVIQEAHYVPQVLSSDQLSRIDTIQRNIGSVITSLCQQLGVRTVYKDGMDPQISARKNGEAGYLYDASRDPVYFAMITDPKIHKGILAKLSASPNPETQKLAKVISEAAALHELTKHDGSFWAAARGLITLSPAERTDLMNKALTLSGKLKDSDTTEWKELSEQREDHLLNLILQGNTHYQVAVMGLGHDLIDNVRRHNTANPAQAINLIVVKPAGLDYFDPKE